jgi:hypothetical protein
MVRPGLHNSLVSKNLTLHHIYVLLFTIYSVIVYNCYMNTLISTCIFKCGSVLAFILLTVYIYTHTILYNVVHLHLHIFYICTDTVRTVSSGNPKPISAYALVHVIINTTSGTVI